MKKNCVYKLDLGNGEVKMFNSELDLNNYIKNNLSAINITDVDAIYSLSEKALSIVTKLENVNSSGTGYSVNQLLETKTID